MRPLLPLTLACALSCTSSNPPKETPVGAFAEAVSAERVEVAFTEALASHDPGAMRAFDVESGQPLALGAVRVEGEILSVETAVQTGGRLYALVLGPLGFDRVAAADVPAQVNFRGYGRAEIELRLDTRAHVAPSALDALITVDLDTGAYSPELRRVPMQDDGSGMYFARFEVRLAENRPYAARAITDTGEEASGLVSFVVTSTRAQRIDLPPRLKDKPEFEPPLDPNPGDGRAAIRILLDDRLGLALSSPELRSSLDASGAFDLASARVDPVLTLPGKPRVYELLFEVEVDARRSLAGTTRDTFPYIAFLVEGGEDFPSRGLTFVVPDETPQVHVVPIGNPALVPVTFRIDAGSAFVLADGSRRGVLEGEGVFLTGEFSGAEDALGRLAADAFSGGERPVLEMRARPDAPAVYEKTIFLPPNRPYGWKAVRCPTAVGCTELNRLVTSTGRAFATVMKNLVTHPVDAATSQEAVLVDPASLGSVRWSDGSLKDYTGARVSESGADAPSNQVLFKQEAPDLLVNVGTDPLITPIYIVGCWRDVNIPTKPLEIIANGQSLDLEPFDYDDGFAGAPPLIRELELPRDPGPPVRAPGEPAFGAADGVLDRTATRVLFGGGRLPLYLAWNEIALYVATEPATPGVDHFIFVSFTPPDLSVAAQWNKAGRVAVSAASVFLAMEGNGDFSGWFGRGPAGTAETLIEGAAAAAGLGGVLEGQINLGLAGLPPAGASVWVAVVPYGTRDRDPLVPAAQSPAGNGDFNLDEAELLEVSLESIRAR